MFALSSLGIRYLCVNSSCAVAPGWSPSSYDPDLPLNSSIAISKTVLPWSPAQHHLEKSRYLFAYSCNFLKSHT